MKREYISPERHKFYHSKAWLKCRRAYGDSRNWICERCGDAAAQVHHRVYLTDANLRDPDVALNWDNLELLCDVCHAQEHHGGGFQTADGLRFDANGDLIEAPRGKPENKTP